MSLDYDALLGSDAARLLEFDRPKIPAAALHLPGPDFVDRTFADTDRTVPVLRNLQTLFSSGRLGGTGYLSILPVDQGMEHSTAYAFVPNPMYLDPDNIVRLAMEAGCSAVASTLGGLSAVARKRAHRIPFVLKINHNELLSLPARHEQTLFADISQAWDMGAVAVGATVYFGSPECRRQIEEVTTAFRIAHQEFGLATILWAYLRNPAFTTPAADYHLAADLTGQANYMAATMGADIVKQKMATVNGGYVAVKFGKTHPKLYEELTSDHPIDLVRWQVANCHMGRAGLINSGGDSTGAGDLAEAVRTAVINKRAGGMGLIAGRKAFQRPFEEGAALLRAIQDVYLDARVTVA